MKQIPTLASDVAWDALIADDRLAVMTDLDGTLIPFADSPENAPLDEEMAATLCALSEMSVRVVVVSGRPRPRECSAASHSVDDVIAARRFVSWIAAGRMARRTISPPPLNQRITRPAAPLI
jgi:predicted HAD superfamily phosphohydrolase YqeG